MPFRSALDEVRALYDLGNYALAEALEKEKSTLMPKEGEKTPKLPTYKQSAYIWMRNQLNDELTQATKDWLLHRYETSSLSAHAHRLDELTRAIKDGSLIREFKEMEELKDKTFARIDEYSDMFDLVDADEATDEAEK